MITTTRCLYNNTFNAFLTDPDMSVFGRLIDGYHGIDLTTQREAWKSEIEIMRATLEGMIDRDGQIIFEYDIPRLGKRIDVVLLYQGIVFCIEFKVGERHILEADRRISLDVRPVSVATSMGAITLSRLNLWKFFRSSA